MLAGTSGHLPWVTLSGRTLAIRRLPCRRVPAGTVDTALSYCHYTLNDRTLDA